MSLSKDDFSKLQLLVDQFCKNLIGYEDGDIFGALDLEDLLNKILDLGRNYLWISALAQFLLEQSDLLHKGAYLEVAEKLSRGGDLLQHGVYNLENPDQTFLTELDAYFAPRKLEDFDSSNDLEDYDSSLKSEIEQLDTSLNVEVDKKLDHQLLETLGTVPFQTFSLEMEERHNRIEELILLWEDSGNYVPDLVNELFRVFHTIKGECGFFGLVRIAEVAHELETLLDLLRNNESSLSTDLSTLLLSGNDTAYKLSLHLSRHDISAYNSEPIIPFISEISNAMRNVQPHVGEMLVNKGQLKNDQVEHLLDVQQQEHYNRKIGEIALDEGLLDKENLSATLEEQTQKSKTALSAKKNQELVNVQIEKIRNLSSLVQELWIKESQIDSEEVRGLKKITKDIQSIILSLQTVKMGRMYTQLRRMVRDLSQKMDKSVTLTCFGDELEIDRSMVNNLDEPMVHIIRNSMDHGIESPEERKKAGKNPTGKITVSSKRQGNRIYIQIRDDGKGLNREKILEKALKKGLVTAAEAESMPSQMVWKLIFHPGFSTAEEVTQYSGRGVGMDVVNAMVRQFRGRIQIDSVLGQFTEITLSFPLNMAIIEGMAVAADRYKFIIPVSEIVQCVELENTNFQSVADKTKVITIMGEVIPVIPLCELFCGISDMDRYKAAVIVMIQKRKFALLVEDILEKLEVALKPLGWGLENLPGISSGTIFSGGKIGYILDIEEVVQMEVTDG